MTTGFETPQDAEDAFYDAFEAHDLEAMLAVWDEAQDVFCLQPMGHLLHGLAAIRESWQTIFRHARKPDVEIRHRQWFESEELALHVVEERITLPGMPGSQLPALIASNVYRRTENGWRMVCHQVSPPPPALQAPGQI